MPSASELARQEEWRDSGAAPLVDRRNVLRVEFYYQGEKLECIIDADAVRLMRNPIIQIAEQLIPYVRKSVEKING